ncbi:hypothetical protein CY35_18G027300 [Sphagnum magellanicum]|nr:hypothetical protein CY35_18G027300 [Sphagnum magellanicum]KAH9532977.1 hypothetical protein CY35_18G027300 [Sphagnum magellanicum]
MVHITEIRVVLPMTVEEFKRGQRYANWKTNEYNTKEGQGGQLLSSVPYEHEVWGEGIYTHSLYRLGDRLPDWVVRLVPSNALVIDEKTWMTYPFIRTIITIPFFNKLKIEMFTMHENDNGTIDNIHNLTETELAIRKVDMVDIAFDPIPKRDYQAELDPKLFSSKKTRRGPLTKEWHGSVVPVMCAYKLVKVEANYWGVQSRAEKLMLSGIRQVVFLTHRNAFCWMDEWFDLTFDEICARESDGRRKLKAAVKQPPIVDPNTGKELVVENGDLSSRGTDDSDPSDIEVEFFEAEMELASQEVNQFGVDHVQGVEGSQLIQQHSDVPERCAVCAARGKLPHPPVLLCKNCNEFFCQSCFSKFHITSRLKSHLIQKLPEDRMVSLTLNGAANGGPSFGELIEKDKLETGGTGSYAAAERLTLVMTRSNPESFDGLPLLENEQEKMVLSIKKEVRNVPDVGSALKEGRQIRAPSKLRRARTSYGVLNEFLESDRKVFQIEASPGPAFPLPEVFCTGKDIRQVSSPPNELSEELLRVLSSLYRQSATSLSLKGLSHTSSNDFGSEQRLDNRNLQEAATVNTTLETRRNNLALDPYGVREENNTWETGPYASMLEVTMVPSHETLKESSALLKRLRELVGALKHVEPKKLNHEQRMAFWINVYNSLLLHAYLVYGAPKNHSKRTSLMSKATYIVGDYQYSPLAIEHSILRANSYRPSLSSLLPVHKYKKNDERLASVLEQAEPLISFALACGTRSSPAVRIYTSTNIKAELEAACQDFLVASVGVSRQKHVLIPKILHWYARDFSHDATSLMKWVVLHLPPDQCSPGLDECLKIRPGKQPRYRVSVVPYNWSFRYLLDSQ